MRLIYLGSASLVAGCDFNPSAACCWPCYLPTFFPRHRQVDSEKSFSLPVQISLSPPHAFSPHNSPSQVFPMECVLRVSECVICTCVCAFSPLCQRMLPASVGHLRRARQSQRCITARLFIFYFCGRLFFFC